MRWTESCKIARELAETYPEIDPISMKNSDIQASIARLLQPKSNLLTTTDLCYEQLKSIQCAWIEESKSWHIDI